MSLDLSFKTTNRVAGGAGIANTTGERLRALNCTKALIVTDKGVIGAGLVDPVKKALEQAGVAYDIFDEVVADPPVDMVFSAAKIAREGGANGIVGLGGGSPMDTAKLVAYLLTNDMDDLEPIYGVDLAKGERAPLILIPTTSGTGSEVTPISIVTTASHEKKGVVADALYADAALLDAELTLGLPPAVTAATGIDAMVHAIEAYTSKIKKNPISDSLAIKALQLMSANLLTAVKDGKNLAAREAMLTGSCLAGMAFANSPCAGVHALAYPLGGHFHVPHGLSNSLVLPHVLRHNIPGADKMYAELSEIFVPGPVEGDNRAASNRLIDALDDMITETDIPRTLRDVGVKEADIPMLAEDAMKQTRLLVNNPVEISYDDAVSIYSAAY